MIEKEQPKLNIKSKLWWSVISLLIAAGSVYAVVTLNENFKFSEFVRTIGDLNLWIIMAFVCAAGFVLFEGLAIRATVKEFGWPVSVGRSVVYSATDIYFSAITPSATGGQPAAAYFMLKDNIPGAVTTATLIFNLAMYAFAILFIGIIGLILRPSAFFNFDTFSRILILIGSAIQIGLAVFFVLLVFSKKLLENICTFFFKLGAKLHIVRNPEKSIAKLANTMENYRRCANVLSRRSVIKVFFLNVLQRASLVFVPMFVYLASGGTFRKVLDMISVQSYVILGSNCVPVPGAMGVYDYLLINGMTNIATDQQAVNIELISRSISFYGCILICGITVVSYWFIQRKRRVN